MSNHLLSVLGMDPSLRNWGLGSGTIDLETGILSEVRVSVIQPKETKSKQVRQNSKDLEIAQLLATGLIEPVAIAHVIFVEVPVGSQSARAMASYGVCVGILGSLQARNAQIIEVTPTEVKMVMTGRKDATKQEMIDAAYAFYPHAGWPMQDSRVVASKAEHMADAIGAIHAGVRTPVFKNLMRLYMPDRKQNTP